MRAMAGRTFDLTGAYRQCAVVQEPQSDKLYGCRMRALPFGAVRSLHSFLRFAFSIWSILVSEFLVLDNWVL